MTKTNAELIAEWDVEKLSKDISLMQAVKLADGLASALEIAEMRIKELEGAKEENDKIKSTLDAHLPTVIYGLNVYIQELMHTTERETRTPMQIGLMAAHSAAHWIAKDVSRGGGEALYDLPSVIDLLTTLKKERADSRVKEVWDSGYEACRTGLQKFRNPFNERTPREEPKKKPAHWSDTVKRLKAEKAEREARGEE